MIIVSIMACGMLTGCGSSNQKPDTTAPPKTTNSANENTDKNNTDKQDNDTTKNNTDKQDNDITKNNTDKQDNNAAKNSTDKSKENTNTDKKNVDKPKQSPDAGKKDNTATNNRQQCIQVPVTIINGTDVDFAGLYASGASVKDWGDNIIDEGEIFEPGDRMRATFNVDVNNLRWDFKAVDIYGDYLVFNGLDLSQCDSSGITIKLSYNRTTGTGTITAE